MSALEEPLGGGVKGQEFVRDLEKLTSQCAAEGENYRSNLDPKLFQDAADYLKKSIPSRNSVVDEDAFRIITPIYRFLRNAVAGCKRNQDLIREKTNIVEISNSILDLVVDFYEISVGTSNCPRANAWMKLNLVCVRCILQFLVNFMVSNVDNGQLIRHSSIHNIAKLMKKTEDEKIIEYAAMNYHTLLKLIPAAEGSLDTEIIPIMLEHTHLEFVMYLMETLCTNDQFMTRTIPYLNVDRRVKVIRVIVAHTELHAKLSVQAVQFLSDRFKQNSDLIFTSQLENDEWMAWEIASLLELLCCLSALDNESNLKTDSALLTTAIFLLKSVHSTKKPQGNESNPSSSFLDFSPVSDIEAMKVSSDTEEMRSRPTFQFKAHLIRLIANLTHRNFPHQELVRETEILPVILDSCNIDARNPFITQWAVLAVRNACEGNTANQELVRSVQQIDTKKTLADPKVQLIDL